MVCLVDVWFLILVGVLLYFVGVCLLPFVVWCCLFGLRCV